MIIQKLVSLSTGTLFLCFFCSQKTKNAEGAFYTREYRNLFLENGYSQEEISGKINSAFMQLFHGYSATQTVYFETGSNENGLMAYVSDVLHNDVRSEGISYGMIIAVQMDRKAEFNERYYDGLLYLMGMLHCSGEFKIWHPQP
ncbi:MAG: hypothetical protein V1903_02885 [Bacteroidota bacterium]